MNTSHTLTSIPWRYLLSHRTYLPRKTRNSLLFLSRYCMCDDRVRRLIHTLRRSRGLEYGTDAGTTPPLTKTHAQDLVLKLTDEERSSLLAALQEYESEKVRMEYQGQLARVRWRSKFGRPSKLPRVGDVDPTGSYCPVPEDWLKRKFAEKVVPPTAKELWGVSTHQALPFIGFGFLDNLIMIVAGDYIDLTLGTYLGITTLAAAALGNTISDVAGIGSAWYVESVAIKVGVRPPQLTPQQLEMRSSRWAANLGRAYGVTLGCLLGMVPLWFLPTPDKEVPKPLTTKEAEESPVGTGIQVAVLPT
ncbi:uncharacterized protein LOC124172723 [Ischnura elegans]|uniref:uncharacterized protein LOC124172723 n=1 Tax=Ischnura elegans TaxID=197161 RepID=UPI001ED88F7D|nr:uncharacterized protein LOC124172723 [Ischnura elegans]